jgi:hypothetical protein
MRLALLPAVISTVILISYKSTILIFLRSEWGWWIIFRPRSKLGPHRLENEHKWPREPGPRWLLFLFRTRNGDQSQRRERRHCSCESRGLKTRVEGEKVVYRAEQRVLRCWGGGGWEGRHLYQSQTGRLGGGRAASLDPGEPLTRSQDRQGLLWGLFSLDAREQTLHVAIKVVKVLLWV